jgi:hypothetical protein
MRKKSGKLVLRGQTLRVLDSLDLVRAVGGLDSGAAACPTGHAAADPVSVDCPAAPR